MMLWKWSGVSKMKGKHVLSVYQTGHLKKIMDFIIRCDPDVVQPLRNVVDDTYESSGLKNYIDTHNLGICFFSPLKHGLLTGKYTEPVTFTNGDHRSGVKEFQDTTLLKIILSNKTLLEQRFF